MTDIRQGLVWCSLNKPYPRPQHITRRERGHLNPYSVFFLCCTAMNVSKV
jgi:hypothetical protein